MAQLALAAALRSVAADTHEPDGRLTLADLLARGGAGAGAGARAGGGGRAGGRGGDGGGGGGGDPTAALEEYQTALRYLPLFGTVTAAATSSRGAMAASVAHQFAGHLVAIEEGIAGLAVEDSVGWFFFFRFGGKGVSPSMSCGALSLFIGHSEGARPSG